MSAARLWHFAAVWVTLSFAICAAHAADLGRKTLSGHVPSVVFRLVAQSRMPATNELRLALGLQLRDSAGLEELLRQLYDPGSTNFHRFLTPPQLAARFGPTEQDYQAVRQFAESNGLMVVATYSNRMVLDVKGRVADIERAFQIQLKLYRHPVEARDFYAPDVEPSVPAGLNLISVEGLNDFSPPRPASTKRRAAASQPLSFNGTGPNHEYAGNDFRSAYVPGSPLNGAGQTVALLEYSDYFKLDVTNYENYVGALNGVTNYVPLTNVVVGGVVPGTNGDDEVSLDIEMAVAMAPNLSRVLVYEESSASSSVLSQIQSDNLARQVSSSWTVGPWSSSTAATWDNILQLMAAQGQSYFQSSGDHDAYTGNQTLDTGTTVPADSPYATVVGGTSLTMSSYGVAWSSETVWNYNDNGIPNEGSGGGVSTYYAQPWWQTNVNMANNGGSATLRNTPDVALTADDIFVCYGDGNTSGSEYFMGTSAAAPLWAGFTALVNQQASLGGKSSVGFLNPAIYALGTNANYSLFFNDVTAGNNIGTNTSGLYVAVAGYDLCTGLGTPNGTNLIDTLEPFPGILSQPASQYVTNGANVAFSITALGAPPLFFRWLFNGTNLSNGGNVSGSSGNVLSLTAVTANNAGNYNLVLSNSYGSITSSVAVLGIGFPPAFSTQPTNLTVLGGSNAVFGAGITGSATLIYQWLKNGTNLVNSAGISGANSNLLTLAAVTPGSAGNYNLLVSNYYGAATSTIATLTVVVPPSITNAGWALLAGNATPTNGAVNPGETVTVSFTLQNQGTVSTSNLVATLLASTNILEPGSPQSYGALAGFGGAANQAFSFTAAGACGANIVASLQLQDGTNILGVANFTLPLGQSGGFAQNFDGITAPSLPSGWTVVTVTNTANNWVTIASSFDTAPNSAFDSDSASSGENALVSPVIPIASTNAQLAFRQNYSLEYKHTFGTFYYYDGGVLEISIGGGVFTDIVSAGGSFVTGGYSGSITTTSDNPIGGRAAWVGSSGGWKSVTVNLPPSAAGQTIQLRWNCATDTGNAGGSAVGWYVDTISITNSTPECLSVFADLAISQSLAAGSLQTGQNLIYTLAVTNLGPQAAASVVVTDAIPANAAFISAPGGNYAGGQVVFAFALLPVNSATNFLLTLAPVSGNVFTNVATVATVTPQISATNNSAALIAVQFTPVNITNAPVAQTIQCGSNPGFTVTATGTAPLEYQWTLDGAAIPAATNTSLLLTNVHLPSHTVAVIVTNLYGGATSSVPLIVQDTIPPVITLSGTNPFYVQLGGAYVEPGATAYDLCAGLVPVSINGAVNTNAVSTNAVIYTAVDGSGNTTMSARTVLVLDTTPPTILWSFTNLVLAANSNCVAVMPNVTGTNFIQATDFSGVASIVQTPTNGAILPLGSNVVVIAVADPYDNTAYSTNTIAVEDQTPPLILLQPLSETNATSATANFTVAATACTPLAFQWFSNNAVLTAQTNSTLILSNLSLSAAGNYAVVVSAAGGSVTSAVVTLMIYVPPGISGVAAHPDGSIALNLTGGPGDTYVLEAATNLSSPVAWLYLATNTLGTNGIWQFTDLQATNFAQQFYRLLLAP